MRIQYEQPKLKGQKVNLDLRDLFIAIVLLI